MDYVVAHYTDNELLDLLEVEHPTYETIKAACIDKQQKHADDADLVRFFTEAANVLFKAYPANTRTVTRIITVDSAFRDPVPKNNINSGNFNFYLSETLSNVTSVSLLSVEIPHSWYTFSKTKGNTGAVVQTLDDSDNVLTFSTCIQDGNYSATDLVAAVVLALNTACSPTFINPFSASFNPVNHIVTLTSSFPRTVKLTFFDQTQNLRDLANARANKSLGWNLGFRDPFLVFEPSTAHTAFSPISVAATRYILMKLDDYCHARFNNATVQIGRPDRRTRAPSTGSLMYRAGTGDSYIQTVAPRIFNSARIFAANANAANSYDYVRDYDDPDCAIFAKIPLKPLDCDDFGKNVVEFSGPLQLNVRDYFEPITLTALAVSLFDDKNNLLDLNGCDWSFSLLFKQLA